MSEWFFKYDDVAIDLLLVKKRYQISVYEIIVRFQAIGKLSSFFIHCIPYLLRHLLPVVL